jgi:hypothetical protein
MTRTFWLSFADPARPAGEQFLGVCIVQVTDADRIVAHELVTARFSHAAADADWIAAATRKAHALGCNPGGQVMSVDITADWPPPADYDVPLDTLLSYDDLVARGLQPVRAPDTSAEP